MNSQWSFVLLPLLAGACFAQSARASETDQYTRRHEQVSDVSPQINARVNGAIERAVERWRGERNDYKFARSVRWKVDGTLAFGRISFWADRIEGATTVDTTWDSVIYRGIPPWTSFVQLFPHLAHTLGIGTARVGSDKLTHMFSVGWNEFNIFRRRGEAAALRYGMETEHGPLGYAFNGVYSNGDLVANAEGMRFYRSLTEEGLVDSKPAIIRWEGDRPVIQRPFDILDHANEYWDESLNSNHYRTAMRRHVIGRLRGLCSGYRADPELYDIDPERDAELRARYANVGLIRHEEARLATICALP
ncbi:MAG: hypothetical protein IT285_03180 [Bdellovibrionales bacterium]|nr:hypothetical protein [Bdellovibrionales bacterium]